jgi:protein N-lysine methyltransferase METTL21D
MRFTASPVVELPVGGAVLMFEQDNDSFEVGTSVWPSSLVLVKFVERCICDPALPFADVPRFPGTRAVELESGCGPAGLGLSRLGLTDITPVEAVKNSCNTKHGVRNNSTKEKTEPKEDGYKNTRYYQNIVKIHHQLFLLQIGCFPKLLLSILQKAFM